MEYTSVDSISVYFPVGSSLDLLQGVGFHVSAQDAKHLLIIYVQNIVPIVLSIIKSTVSIRLPWITWKEA